MLNCNILFSYFLEVAKNRALAKLLHYSSWHADVWDGHKPFDAEVEDFGVFVANVWGLQGIGNVVYNMASVLLMAMYSLNYRIFSTVFSSKALDRYGGVFSHALGNHDLPPFCYLLTIYLRRGCRR